MMKWMRPGNRFVNARGPAEHAAQFLGMTWSEPLWPYDEKAYDKRVLMSNFSVWKGITKGKTITVSIKLEAKVKGAGYCQADISINGGDHVAHVETELRPEVENRVVRPTQLVIPLGADQGFDLRIGVGVMPGFQSLIEIGFTLDEYSK